MAERPAARVAHLVAILTVNAEGSGTRAAFAARLQHRDRGRDLDARDQQLGRLQGEGAASRSSPPDNPDSGERDLAAFVANMPPPMGLRHGPQPDVGDAASCHLR